MFFIIPNGLAEKSESLKIVQKADFDKDYKKSIIKQIKNISGIEYDENTDKIIFFKDINYYKIVVMGLLSSGVLSLTTMALLCAATEILNDERLDIYGLFLLFSGLFAIPSYVFIKKIINLFKKNIPYIVIDDDGIAFIESNSYEKIYWSDIKSINISKMIHQNGKISCRNLILKLFDTREYTVNRSSLFCCFEKFYSIVEHYLETYNENCLITEYSYMEPINQVIIVP